MFGWSFVFYFYVVHGSYIIKEKYRKITRVSLLRKLSRVSFAGFIVILLAFWFLLELLHMCGLNVCFFIKKQLLCHVSDG